GPRDPAGGGGAVRARDGHRPVRLPEPDQQRAVLPRVLPRPARLPRPPRERRHEDRGGPRDRLLRGAERARPRVHHPERVQQEGRAGGGAGGRAGRAEDRRGPTTPAGRRPRLGVAGPVTAPDLRRSPHWSIVIPAYDEAVRLPGFLKDVLAYFEERDETFEVVVVDDGSTDGTAERVREVAVTRAAVVVHALDRNRGKGAAVRAGMARARGALRLMADADGATPIAEVGRLEAALRAGADVAVGSRILEDPGVARQVR